MGVHSTQRHQQQRGLQCWTMNTNQQQWVIPCWAIIAHQQQRGQGTQLRTQPLLNTWGLGGFTRVGQGARAGANGSEWSSRRRPCGATLCLTWNVEGRCQSATGILQRMVLDWFFMCAPHDLMNVAHLCMRACRINATRRHQRQVLSVSHCNFDQPSHLLLRVAICGESPNAGFSNHLVLLKEGAGTCNI